MTGASPQRNSIGDAPCFKLVPNRTNKKVSQIWLWVIAKMQADQERAKKASEARWEDAPSTPQAMLEEMQAIQFKSKSKFTFKRTIRSQRQI